MMSAIVISKIENPRELYVVNPADWISQRVYTIDAQILNCSDTEVIQKSDYKVAGYLDESGVIELFERK